MRFCVINVSQTSLLLMETLSCMNGDGVRLVFKRRKRSPRLYAPHGRQKYFSILGDLFQELLGLFYQTIFDHRSGVNFHLLRHALAPLFTPPPPHPTLGPRNNSSLAGYITLGPRQAMKSGAGELAIARGRVAKYLRFIFFFRLSRKKHKTSTRYIFLESTHNNLKPE